jgi:Beta-glucosidase-related glycosidases
MILKRSYGLGALCLGLGVGVIALTASDSGIKWSDSKVGPFTLVKNNGGASLGYTEDSGVKILTVDGFAFKDLNKNGKLDPYEDWRLPVATRAKDLASKMSVEQIAGLMLYSSHQKIPGGSMLSPDTFGGQSYDKSGANPWDLSDGQKKMLKDDNLRHVLITTVSSPADAARWNNAAQAFVEGFGLGIPINTSSDPRNGITASTEYNAGNGGAISMWPENLGLAATFDPALVERFGQVAAKEYRALGISTALSPQIDLATEPRWSRYVGTFGEDPQLAKDLARAYVDGFQTSKGADEIANGWGYSSVNAMIKHWPSGGPEEGGRDAHFAYGKFAVYPGNNLDEQVVPFVDGGMKLAGSTKSAAAVMPYYTVSFDQDTKNKENVGNSYSRYLITDLLRNTYKYDGVVCTDWMITADSGPKVSTFSGKNWGVENLSIAQRHYKALVAGVDQFGGNNEAGPVIEAYKMGVAEFGEAAFRARFEASAVRLLTNIFRAGLFENPYLDVDKSVATVGNPDYMAAGYKAQLKSLVLLKNEAQVLPMAQKKTVYIPKKFVAPVESWWGTYSKAEWVTPVNLAIVQKYYNVTDDPSKADFALVFVDQPLAGTGYDSANDKYQPIKLQYGDYVAEYGRDVSIAGGYPLESSKNRSYKGQYFKGYIEQITPVIQAKVAMKGKPVVVSLHLTNPTVVAEFEKYADAILLNFGVQDQAIVETLAGISEPSGLLPCQLPADMKTVEQQYEDVPHDMVPYVDAAGHAYDFGYGLNWKGVIADARTAKYAVPVATPTASVASGSYGKTVSVKLACATKGAKIYFTTDGSQPAFVPENEYKAPISVSATTTLKVIAKIPGFDNSEVATYEYFIKK